MPRPSRNRRHANRGCVVLSRRSDGIAGQIANQFRSLGGGMWGPYFLMLRLKLSWQTQIGEFFIMEMFGQKLEKSWACWVSLVIGIGLFCRIDIHNWIDCYTCWNWFWDVLRLRVQASRIILFMMMVTCVSLRYTLFRSIDNDKISLSNYSRIVAGQLLRPECLTGRRQTFFKTEERLKARVFF